MLLIGTIVFLANAALLVLQLMAGRLLSPFIGSSLATWTAVIGMFLAGISVGNWIGGLLADRAATGGTLRGILVTGGCTVILILAATRLLGDGSATHSIMLPWRIALLSFVVCFPPAFVLSLATPVAIKLLLSDVHRTGGVVGTVYAIGTLGSLVGNFVTGFYLIALFGTSTIVLCTGAGLMLLAALVPSATAVENEDRGTRASLRYAHIDPRHLLTLPVACAIVFLCSFGSMALELSASRLLAPSVGVSLYTWTGIIGVVLAGIVTGNYLGGWIADRSPKRSTLGTTLFWTGMLTLSILILFHLIGALSHQKPIQPSQMPGWEFWTPAFWLGLKEHATFALTNAVSAIQSANLPSQIVALSIVLFFAPMVAFGTISPQVTRLAVRDWEHAGRVAGRVYAWSCAGAIAGTFATGWILIDQFGVMRLIFGLALALVALALPVGRLWRKPVESFGCALVLAAAILAAFTGHDRYLRFSPNAIYERETNYFLVRVLSEVAPDSNSDKSHVRQFCQDQLVHSHIRGKYVERDGQRLWEADVADLGYEYEQVQTEFARVASSAHANPQILLIGGGGYAMPRWIDRFLPQASMEVVEIDPGVTEAVHLALGMPRQTRIRSHNLDGRQFVQELAQPRRYHLVVQDAVNDFSVPSHIMTLEYNRAVRKILTDDGVFLLTVIDEFAATKDARRGKLLPAAIRTMQASFPHVYLLGYAYRDQAIWQDDGRRVFIIAGMSQPLDMGRFREVLAQQGLQQAKTMVMPAEDLTAYLETIPPVILSDDYAPTDNLLAEAFRRR